MPRIDGVQPANADIDIASEYQRHEARYGAPLFNHTVLARCPAIFRGFRAMWNGIDASGRLPPALISLINTQVARLVGCGLWIEINSAVGREQGIDEAQLQALSNFEQSPLFNEEQKSALAYARAIAKDDLVSSHVFDRLRVHYSDDEIVELTAAITWELCVSKFNRALEIEAQGICLLPEVK